MIVSVCYTGILSLCKCTCQYKENQQAMEVQHRSCGTFVGDLFEGFWVFFGLRNCDVNEDTVSGTIVLCDSLCLYNVDRCYWLVFYSLSLYQVAVLEWLQCFWLWCRVVFRTPASSQAWFWINNGCHADYGISSQTCEFSVRIHVNVWMSCFLPMQTNCIALSALT